MIPSLETISTLSPAALLLFGLNILGYVISKSPLRNEIIPLVLPAVGAIVYIFIAPIDVTKSSASLQGFCIGGLAIFANQLFRNAVDLYAKTTTGNSDGKPPTSGL